MTSSHRIDSSLLWILPIALLSGAAAVQGAVHPADRPIRDSYIVVLRADAGAQSIGAPKTTAQLASELSSFYGGQASKSYRSALQGFAFRGSSASADNLSRDSRVAYVAQDGEVTLSAVQTPAPWGLDRIDQRDPSLDTEYGYGTDGAGVDVYVVDTGIRSTHEEFGGRVDTVNAFTAVDDGLGTEDCNGHGTMVAGVVGSATYGVAKGVALHPVRVVGCDGTGSISNVVAGIDWLTQRQQAPGARRAVVNMSLYNGFSFPLEAAVSTAIAAGVVFVAAAGNDNMDIPCDISPQRMPAVITVGASDDSGARWEYSNYGACLGLFAPGVQISTTLSRNDTDTTTHERHLRRGAARRGNRRPGPRRPARSDPGRGPGADRRRSHRRHPHRHRRGLPEPAALLECRRKPREPLHGWLRERRHHRLAAIQPDVWNP